MKYVYEPEGICPMEIVVSINNNILEDVEFNGGGCDGNLKALKRVIIGMNIDEIKEKFTGITCGYKETSCMDQLVNAVMAAKESM